MGRSHHRGPLLAILLATVVCLPIDEAGAASTSATRHRLEQVVAGIKALGVPGGVIGVTGGNVGRYATAFGNASAGKPMTLNARFRIGSVTKTFTATVILQLVDRHLLGLDQRISRWEPKIPGAKRITIRMLLGMTSGIWDEGGAGPTGRTSLLGQWVSKNCHPAAPSPNCGRYWKPQQLVDLAIDEGPAAYPPGVFYYSDTNYMILGIIAQRLTGRSLGSLLAHMIFAPLHMRHTSFPTRSLSVPGPATRGYVAAPAQNPTGYKPGPVPSPSASFGAGNIISTLGDLQVWALALGTGALLKPATQRVRLQMLPLGGSLLPLAGMGVRSILPLNYGLGLSSAGSMIGHNGELSYPGYTAELWYVPAARGSVVALFNSVTLCEQGTLLLSDSTASTLAQLAFGPSALYRVSAPGFPGVDCPALAAP